jgi:hypothetical protein
MELMGEKEILQLLEENPSISAVMDFMGSLTIYDDLGENRERQVMISTCRESPDQVYPDVRLSISTQGRSAQAQDGQVPPEYAYIRVRPGEKGSEVSIGDVENIKPEEDPKTILGMAARGVDMFVAYKMSPVGIQDEVPNNRMYDRLAGKDPEGDLLRAGFQPRSEVEEDLRAVGLTNPESDPTSPREVVMYISRVLNMPVASVEGV